MLGRGGALSTRLFSKTRSSARASEDSPGVGGDLPQPFRRAAPAIGYLGDGYAGRLMNTREKLINWLQDAHAMERSVEQILERHIKDAEGFEAVELRLENHLDDTRDHIRRVTECLAQLGATPSMTKSFAGGMLGAVQGMATGAMGDPLVRNAVADYAVEHFEIACYQALITTATEAGEDDIAATCEVILRDELDMATWLEEQIPELTRSCLDFPSATK